MKNPRTSTETSLAATAHDSYEAYLRDMETFRPERTPLSLEGYVAACERWDREYAAAWERDDLATVTELETLLCA